MSSSQSVSNAVTGLQIILLFSYHSIFIPWCISSDNKQWLWRWSNLVMYMWSDYCIKYMVVHISYYVSNQMNCNPSYIFSMICLYPTWCKWHVWRCMKYLLHNLFRLQHCRLWLHCRLFDVCSIYTTDCIMSVVFTELNM